LQTNDYKISVVLLTKNSAETVGKTLESIMSQTHKPDEIVVVDGNSKDNTVDNVK
jgi:glycosyltransferase involved in cell wall biosynthesis